MELIYSSREQTMEVDKLHPNNLRCMVPWRAVQAHAPKPVSEQAGGQIHFSSELPSWDIKLGRNQPQNILHRAQYIEFNTLELSKWGHPGLFFTIVVIFLRTGLENRLSGKAEEWTHDKKCHYGISYGRKLEDKAIRKAKVKMIRESCGQLCQ